ncbi:MAG: hypothetical protein WA070_07555 [Sphingobium sp.]
MLAILLPLVLRNRREQMLDENAIGIFAKFDGRRFQNAASLGDVGTKFQVRFDAASEAAYVVDDDDTVIFAMLFDEGEHRDHARAVEKRAGLVVREHANDLMPAIARIFAASRLLGIQTVAFLRLSLGADTAVDDGLLVCLSCHGAKCPSGPTVLFAPSPSAIRGRSTSSDCSDFSRLA